MRRFGPGDSQIEIWQMPSPASPQRREPRRLGGLRGRNLELNEHRVLRRLREAIFVEGRRMDSAPALLDAARETGGLDLDRLQVDLRSNAIVERFGADLERGRGVVTPAFAVGNGAAPVSGYGPYPRVRAAVVAAGAAPRAERPDPEAALRRFGTLATAAVAAACDLPGPRAAAALWGLALEWRVRPRAVPGGELWNLA